MCWWGYWCVWFVVLIYLMLISLILNCIVMFGGNGVCGLVLQVWFGGRVIFYFEFVGICSRVLCMVFILILLILIDGICWVGWVLVGCWLYGNGLVIFSCIVLVWVGLVFLLVLIMWYWMLFGRDCMLVLVLFVVMNWLFLVLFLVVVFLYLVLVVWVWFCLCFWNVLMVGFSCLVVIVGCFLVQVFCRFFIIELMFSCLL